MPARPAIGRAGCDQVPVILENGHEVARRQENLSSRTARGTDTALQEVE